MKFTEKLKAKKADKIENPAKETAKKEKKPLKQKIKDSMNKKYIKNGSYSVVISAVFVVIVLVVNMIVGYFHLNIQKWMSANRNFTVSGMTQRNS